MPGYLFPALADCRTNPATNFYADPNLVPANRHPNSIFDPKRGVYSGHAPRHRPLTLGR